MTRRIISTLYFGKLTYGNLVVEMRFHDNQVSHFGRYTKQPLSHVHLVFHAAHMTMLAFAKMYGINMSLPMVTMTKIVGSRSWTNVSKKTIQDIGLMLGPMPGLQRLDKQRKQ